ncbi:Berberine/berberine-like protein [Kalmanozyma brasiliensis GHG001]|uniref:FAD-binding PCMH-type domain-containing protein n=1 Tax=Kalmanozyma brasiliensis (strain GHG001) TaxID=1365824 RepID=V5F227_KALBG|nr:Berberine/berberine-like protein [Kalmanozyma brasiliensis GHG001]EST09419.1 Berberine/berberine-like protein [Kalmanozyma brasiliensis GHG001]
MTTRIPPYDIPEPTPLTKEEVRDTYARFESLRADLARTFRGQIAIRGEAVFAKSITIFNDAAPLGGWMVAIPVDVHDISTVVKFCAAHRLSPSIKSGGYATAGWSIQGQVVIDTSLMDDVKLVVPKYLPSESAAAMQGVDSSPLTVPAAVGPTATYNPTGMCAVGSDGLCSSSEPSSSQPTTNSDMASSAVAAIDPITARTDADSIVLQSDSVSAADRLVKQQIHSTWATPIQDTVTKRDPSNGESSEDIDPQDPAKNALKRKMRASDQASIGSSDPAAAGLVRRRTDPVEDANVKSAYMQHGRSHESGADADSESSGASSTRDRNSRDGDVSEDRHRSDSSGEPSNPDDKKRTVAASRSDFLDASEPRDSAPLYRTPNSGSGSSDQPRAAPVPAKAWVDRQLDLSGNASDSPSGSNSGSTGGGSSSNLASSSTSASKHSSAKSWNASADRADVKMDTDAVGGASTDDMEDEAARFKRPDAISLPRHTAPSSSQRRGVSRSGSGSGSGSASDSGRQRRDFSDSQTPDDWDMSASAEHRRWHRHHRPPSATPGEKMKLPEGGFVWRSDGADAGISSISAAPGSLPWDAEAFAASPEAAGAAAAKRPSSRSARSSSGEASSNEMDTSRPGGPGYFGASTLSDLQDAWPTSTWAVNQEGSNDPSSNLPRFIPSPLHKYGSPSPTPQIPDPSNPYTFNTRPEPSPSIAAAILPPGMYEDRYALASFGPGVGIRGLDAFTDQAGREGNFLAAMSEDGKGKERQMDQQDALPPLVVNGVPYHVPVSAYPVGSTAMTTGGFGYLTRAYGLSLDNITEVEMVLADGTIVTLNEDSKKKSQLEQDLWWAVRGAAPCFGIVTRLTAKAYPVPSVYSGNLIYPLNPATASSLIRHWRDCLKAGLPRNFYTNLILTAGPSKTSHVIVIQVCYLGPKSDGEALVQAISSWTGERLLLKDVEERSFLSQQDGVAKVLKGGTGRRWMVRGDLISTLTDDVIAKSVRNFQGLGSRAVWLFELMGGAVEDSPADDTCICPEARAAKFTVGSLQQWSGKAEDRTCIESVERWLNEVVDKVSVGGPYPCFLGRSERMDRVIGAYGLENFKRLLEIKQRVDPGNMFRHTFGHGFVVDDPERLLVELEERREVRRRVQEQQAQQAAQLNGQGSSSQE